MYRQNRGQSDDLATFDSSVPLSDEISSSGSVSVYERTELPLSCNMPSSPSVSLRDTSGMILSADDMLTTQLHYGPSSSMTSPTSFAPVPLVHPHLPFEISFDGNSSSEVGRPPRSVMTEDNCTEMLAQANPALYGKATPDSAIDAACPNNACPSNMPYSRFVFPSTSSVASENLES